jgi:hypothetical protein
MLFDADKNSMVVIGFRKDDGKGFLEAYRIFKWMLSHGISAQIHHVKEEPFYLLKGMENYIKLVNALDDDAKGRLERATSSIAIPHYIHPLDEDFFIGRGWGMRRGVKV